MCVVADPEPQRERSARSVAVPQRGIRKGMSEKEIRKGIRKGISEVERGIRKGVSEQTTYVLFK